MRLRESSDAGDLNSGRTDGVTEDDFIGPVRGDWCELNAGQNANDTPSLRISVMRPAVLSNLYSLYGGRPHRYPFDGVGDDFGLSNRRTLGHPIARRRFHVLRTN